MTQGTPVTIGQAAATLAAAQGVTQRCVSLATGTLGPDLRVNYEFGLVLGVDEFRQEQLYFLQKEYQHNRGLHGFGTVYGLRVSTETPEGSQDDLQITVEPGMAIDQYGRAIVVRSPQCARLGAWLAKQVQADPGLIARQRAALSGDLAVYAVLSYTECADALVPIPGQPCDSAQDSSAPSRIRDSYAIELRWAPPAMPAWDAVRRFAELMALVRPVVGLPEAQSDEPLLAELVRLLADPPGYAAALATLLAGSVSETPRELFRLPAATAGPALDRLYTIWATEIRPSVELPPDLSDPAPPAEAGVLLARIDFLPDDPFDPQQPRLSFPRDDRGRPLPPSDEGRPFLLHTQLIQELRSGGAATEKREFATLAARDGATLRVWVHHAEVLDQPQPAALELTAGSGPLPITAITDVAPNVFDLAVEPVVIEDSPQGPPLQPGTLIALRFLLDGVTTGGRALIDDIDTSAVDYLGRQEGGITVYTVVTGQAVAGAPVGEFAHVQTVLIDGALRFRVWFHTPEPVVLPRAISTQRGVGRAATNHNFTVQPAANDAAQFFWTLVPPPNLRLVGEEVLTFSFDTTQITAGDSNAPLAEVIAGQHLQYVGSDGQGTVRVFHVVRPPVQPGLSEEQVNELIKQAIDGLPRPAARPTRPFVTFTPLAPQGTVLEMWLHPTGDPRKNDVEIDRSFAEKRPFQALAELPDLGEMPDLQEGIRLRPVQPNVFRVFLDAAIWNERGRSSVWLRFLFSTNDIVVNADGRQISLREYMGGLPFDFEGAVDDEIIAAYAHLSGGGVQ